MGTAGKDAVQAAAPCHLWLSSGTPHHHDPPRISANSPPTSQTLRCNPVLALPNGILF